MRDLAALAGWRRADDPAGLRIAGQDCALFEMPSPTDGGTLRIVALSADGWDHVLVSRRDRYPDWPEMVHVAALFFKDDEVAMILRPSLNGRVEMPPGSLGWRCPHGREIPQPPSLAIADRQSGLTLGESPEARFLDSLR